MIFTFEETPLEGIKVIRTARKKDFRGSFLKTFHAELFAERQCDLVALEQYFTVSRRDVVRGMHFQAPPADHTKLIYCLRGSILDVVLDLRKSSATYGKSFSTMLSADCGTGLFIPRGFAHGFLALEDDSTAMYTVGSVYHPDLDQGVRWDSFGFKWPIEKALVSERDQAFPSFNRWNSPFA